MLCLTSAYIRAPCDSERVRSTRPPYHRHSHTTLAMYAKRRPQWLSSLRLRFIEGSGAVAKPYALNTSVLERDEMALLKLGIALYLGLETNCHRRLSVHSRHSIYPASITSKSTSTTSLIESASYGHRQGTNAPTPAELLRLGHPKGKQSNGSGIGMSFLMTYHCYHEASKR